MGNNSEEDDSFYRTSKVDLIVIGLVIFFSASSILWVSAEYYGLPFHTRGSSQPAEAIIYQGNTLLKRIDLGKDNIFPILNGKMHIEVKDGKVRVLDSDCPQQTCVKTGWIQYSGRSIVCIPNQVLIELRSAMPQSLDSISY